MKVYLVEEFTWDHHEIVKIFETEEKAQVYCNANFPYKDGQWKTHSFTYGIVEMDVE